MEDDVQTEDSFAPWDAPPQTADADAPDYSDLTHYADGSDKTLIIQHENGSGRREVTAVQYAMLMRKSPWWRVVETHIVAPHHSTFS